MKNKRYLYLLSVLSVVMLFALWILMSELNPTLAGPFDTIDRFIRLMDNPMMGKPVRYHVFASVRRIIVAFFFASVIGVSLGMFFGISPTFRRIMWPVFSIIRPIPPLAWIPIVVLWVGVVGDSSKEIIIFIGMVMAIVINTYEGIRHTDEQLLNAGTILGANRFQMIFDVLLPNSIPIIFAGMKTGLSTGWMSLVAAEMVAAQEGMGFLINMSMKTVPDTALDFVGIILIALCSTVLTVILDFVERKLCPWLNVK